MSRRRFLQGAAALGASALLGTSVAGAYRFVTERHVIGIERLHDAVRLAFLADLHYGPYVRDGSVRAWIEAALAEVPDVVIIGGDLVDAMAGRDVEPLVEMLADLRAPHGVYAVWGNHDHSRFRDLTAFAQALERSGITLLDNAGVAVRNDLYLTGIDDLRTGRPDLPAALTGRGDRATVLVSHNPDVLPQVPGDVDVTLCGHTHGGQIRLPGIGAVVTSSRYGRRFEQGWVRAPALGYVSRGLGVGLIPLRLNCPAELTVLDLVPTARADR
jgi:uncharacterized protein